MNTPTAETLASILGSQVFTFGFPTADAANAHAASRIAQGRPAVTFQDGDVYVCAYGVKGA